ncbi:dihydropteroate synthase [Paradesertivirga mongoliensis]|uniref:dihydropteroate synthase n=1 Tax=Paradesertivirga mongoliensis TaxID=2100740 RepID=A0ABW4ZKR1_9SPHI|nr:dihydropteroate synthase [Pedobacter mongoliensis]
MADKNTDFHQNSKLFDLDASVQFIRKSINVRGQLIDFNRPKVMGILNITPDSFFKGSRMGSVDTAVAAAGTMMEEGADFIDVGAYSSRPGAADVSAPEELNRLIPVISALAKNYPHLIISVDTFRAEVAEAAVKQGAHIINDISGGDLDPKMIETVARLKVPYILMHMKGTPQTMKHLAQYEDVVTEVLKACFSKVAQLKEMGITDYIIDPGFGFAKTIEHNYQLLHRLELFKMLGVPLLAGLSRKSMIWKVLDIDNSDALNGTTVLNTVALMKGADILRVHDVRPAVEAVTLIQKLG